MEFSQLVSAVVSNVGLASENSTSELKSVITADVKAFLEEIRQPALKLGMATVKALLFDSAVEYLNLTDMTDEEVAALTAEGAARREELIAEHAAQLALISKAEQEYQEDVVKVRAATVSFLAGLFEKAGKIGLGILASGMV